MKAANDLQKMLESIDHKSYPAYKSLKGMYQFPGYRLVIDHVQGDPFASPSQVSLWVGGSEAGFPMEYYRTPHQRIALQDYLLRLFHKKASEVSFQAKGSGKSGLLAVSRCKQEMLDRSACQVNPADGSVTLRMEIGFPANGRTIQSRELHKILFDLLPQCVAYSLLYSRYSKDKCEKLTQFQELAVDQQAIREQLEEQNLTAFVANGSILPRRSGISDQPMKDAIRFQSPPSMEVTMNLPYAGCLRGMGVPRGITLIVGGGYHGKSTLLKALELGVYPHIPGDGREYVITDQTALKLRAEDGRSIENVDISMFINHLPNGMDTAHFTTEDASGSTSQAANVAEGMEALSRTFLIDEDTSATNFMIRDELMQRVVAREQEPITPYIERVTELYEQYGISTILVAGSSGAYFHMANRIIQMEQYMPYDITQRAKEAASGFMAIEKAPLHMQKSLNQRQLKPLSKDSGRDRHKVKVQGLDSIIIDRQTIDMRYVEQLVDSEQLGTLGYLFLYAQQTMSHQGASLSQIVERLGKQLEIKGFESIVPLDYVPAGLAMPRPQEIFACFNRFRGGRPEYR